MARRRNQSKQPTGWKLLFSWTITLVLLAVTTLMLAMWNLPALSDWQSARHRMEAAQVRVQREQAAVNRLEKEKEALSGNRQALERAAREEFLMLKPGEQVYVFQQPRRPRP